MSGSPTNLIINYIPQNLADDGLKNIFSQIGVVESCKIMRDFKTGYSYGFAFVNYVTPEDAQKAIQQLNGYQIGSKHIKVSYARPSGENIKDTNLYVTNLPRDITEYGLKKIFEDFGEIVQMNLLKNKDTGSSRGVAFVRYNQRCEAQEAISRLDGQTLPGSSAPLNVRVAQDHGKQKAHYYAGWQAGFRQNHQQVGLLGPHPSFMSRFNSLRWQARPYPNTLMGRERLEVNNSRRFQQRYLTFSQLPVNNAPLLQTGSMRANSLISQQPAIISPSQQTGSMRANSLISQQPAIIAPSQQTGSMRANSLISQQPAIISPSQQTVSMRANSLISQQPAIIAPSQQTGSMRANSFISQQPAIIAPSQQTGSMRANSLISQQPAIIAPSQQTGSMRANSFISQQPAIIAPSQQTGSMRANSLISQQPAIISPSQQTGSMRANSFISQQPAIIAPSQQTGSMRANSLISQQPAIIAPSQQTGSMRANSLISQQPAIIAPSQQTGSMRANSLISQQPAIIAPSQQTGSMRANSLFSQRPAMFATSRQTSIKRARFGPRRCAGMGRSMPTCYDF